MKSINDIASRLIILCQQRQFIQAYLELFSENAVSVDPIYENEAIEGLKKLIEREEKFLAGIELHEVKLSAPIFAGKYFSLVFSINFTAIGENKKSVEEIAVYQVEGNKIVSQQFFIG